MVHMWTQNDEACIILIDIHIHLCFIIWQHCFAWPFIDICVVNILSSTSKLCLYTTSGLLNKTLILIKSVLLLHYLLHINNFRRQFTHLPLPLPTLFSWNWPTNFKQCRHNFSSSFCISFGVEFQDAFV